MNAILREDFEVTVLTNEAIEVHLSYLRPAVEGLVDKVERLHEKLDKANEDRAAGDALLAEKITDGDALLAEKITAGDALLAEKITAGDALLAEKITAGDALLTEKITAGNALLAEKIVAGDAALAEKIDQKFDKLVKEIMKIQASQNGLKWFLTSSAVIASGLSIVHSLGWI
jgi:hypothetical protein